MIAIVALLLPACAAPQPYWDDEVGRVYDDDQIRLYYVPEVAGYCPFSGGVVAGCAALREQTCDIYVRVDHRGDACLAEHERLHCKGRTHSRKLFYEACARPRDSGSTHVAVDAFDVTQRPHDSLGLVRRERRPTPPR